MKRILNKKTLASVLLIGVNFLLAQSREIKLDNIAKDQITLAGFTLESTRVIEIEAIGAGGEKEIHRITNGQEDKFNLFAYAWILDAQTRKLVWRMTISNTEGDWWDKFNRVFKNKVELPKGEYELYFAAIEPSYLAFEDGFLSFGKLMEKMMGSDKWWEDHSAKWKVTVRNVDEIFDKSAVLKYQNAVKNQAIVDMTGISDSQYLSVGFRLKKQTNLKLYCIGEGFKNEEYDYGWIIDASTRKKVWELKTRQTEHAGGAEKNRLIEEEIRLGPGDFIAYYKTDDSHSWESWNANPPYDPNFWGLMISGAGKDFDRSIVEEYAPSEGSVIVALNRVGDDEDMEEGFTLLKPAKIRIYAIGEGQGGEMFDYGWIEDARTGRKVWEMEYRSTEHAGGASKNRISDTIIKLEPGTYIVRYVTDDSHSYRDWNMDPPYDPKNWGITLYSVKTGDISDLIKPYVEEENKNILVELIQVGDYEHVRKQFRLNRDSQVRVYAVGEGDWDEMYDYGWIEDFNTGETVWKMRYNQTRRAGGGSKNRLFDRIISLPEGTYIAHFRTDDSHAYGSWNVTPPKNKSRWGITIYLVED